MSVKSLSLFALSMIAVGIMGVLGAGALEGRTPIEEGTLLLSNALGFGGIIAFGMGRCSFWPRCSSHEVTTLPSPVRSRATRLRGSWGSIRKTPMISAWWLILIAPVVFLLGFVLAASFIEVWR